MQFQPIEKRPDLWQVRPDLLDYEGTCSKFTWEDIAQEVAGLPDGRGVNIAYEAVDRHAAGPRRESPCPALAGERRRGARLHLRRPSGTEQPLCQRVAEAGRRQGASFSSTPSWSTISIRPNQSSRHGSSSRLHPRGEIPCGRSASPPGAAGGICARARDGIFAGHPAERSGGAMQFQPVEKRPDLWQVRPNLLDYEKTYSDNSRGKMWRVRSPGSRTGGGKHRL